MGWGTRQKFFASDVCPHTSKFVPALLPTDGLLHLIHPNLIGGGESTGFQFRLVKIRKWLTFLGDGGVGPPCMSRDDFVSKKTEWIQYWKSLVARAVESPTEIDTSCKLPISIPASMWPGRGRSCGIGLQRCSSGAQRRAGCDGACVR